MKTIEIKSEGRIVRFTTKSVTFDGKEYFYANMSDVAKNEKSHTYTFKYENEYKSIFYEQKDAKILNAIFNQVKQLEKQKLAGTAPKKAAPASSERFSTKNTSEPRERKQKASNTANVASKTASEIPKPQAAAKGKEVSPSIPEKVEEDKAKTEEKKPKKSIKELFAPLKSTVDGGEKKAEKEPISPEKAEKTKKALKVFAIILAITVAVSIVYYFIFGTSSAPKDNAPNSNESQSYDNVEQLIEQMQ